MAGVGGGGAVLVLPRPALRLPPAPPRRAGLHLYYIIYYNIYYIIYYIIINHYMIYAFILSQIISMLRFKYCSMMPLSVLWRRRLFESHHVLRAMTKAQRSEDRIVIYIIILWLSLFFSGILIIIINIPLPPALPRRPEPRLLEKQPILTSICTAKLTKCPHRTFTKCLQCLHRTYAVLWACAPRDRATGCGGAHADIVVVTTWYSHL